MSPNKQEKQPLVQPAQRPPAATTPAAPGDRRHDDYEDDYFTEDDEIWTLYDTATTIAVLYERWRA